VHNLDPFQSATQGRYRGWRDGEALLAGPGRQLASGGSRDDLRMLPLTQATGQGQQGLLASAEAGFGVDVKDRERTSIFSPIDALS
jgi:hypothetical protein